MENQKRISTHFHEYNNGFVGEIVMERAKALNAHDYLMIIQIIDALKVFEKDPQVKSVILTSSSERAFCAGGDIRAVRNMILDDNHVDVLKTFAAEYTMDLIIYNYSKPFISMVDGIAFGGGFGLAQNAKYALVTENALFSMPEISIGFYPDAGATFTLPKLEGGLGRFMGLTGSRITGKNALNCGLAQGFILKENWDDALVSLRKGVNVEEVIEGYGTDPKPVNGLRSDLINEIFIDTTLEEVYEKIKINADWNGLMLSGSPTSIKVTDEILKLKGTFEECIQREYILTLRMTKRYDFLEGVRAAVVDKDHKPKFEPLVNEQELKELITFSESDLNQKMIF